MLFSRVRSLVHKSRACVAIAAWDSSLYGAPPTTLPVTIGTENINHRPVKVHYYLKVNITNTNTFASEILLARVSWFYPLSSRYAIEKPAQLWCNNSFEGFGIHSFVPLRPENLMSRCGYGPIQFEDSEVLVVVPLVE